MKKGGGAVVQDKNGKEIKKGSKVKCVIGGCLGTYTVSKIRPRKGDVVVVPGSWFKTPESVEVITGEEVKKSG